jgi:DNA end-binding protein Ku
MALHSSWDGFLRLSLISIPVRAYNAAVPGGGDIHFHQIHKDCGNRVHYQKVCPVHGVVNKDEIVSGYEYKKNQYVEIDKDEIAKLRIEDDKAINIDAFTDPGDLDAIYLTGKTFYLVPASPAGQKPYVLLHEVMKDKNRQAVATIVLGGHDETVLIRPAAKLLTMTVLYHQDQLKRPTAFQDEVGDAKVTAKERKLAEALVEESTPHEFDFSQYKDRYTERVSKALQVKMSGKQSSLPRREKAPHVINLMEALRKSLAQTQGGGKPKAQARRAGPKRTPRKRKTA